MYVYLVSDILQIGEIISRCFTELHLEDSTDSTNNRRHGNGNVHLNTKQKSEMSNHQIYIIQQADV